MHRVDSLPSSRFARRAQAGPSHPVPARRRRPLAASAAAVAALLLGSLLGLEAQAQSGEGARAQVQIEVANLRNTVGELGCQLFAAETGFPNDADKAKAAAVAPIVGGRARCVFRDLPAGTYAVAVVHDENGNRRVDVNAFGIPKEGYGVSNNRTYAMSAPRWEESRFALAAGENKTLDVKLRY